MNTIDMVHSIAGFFIIISLALGYYFSPYWHLFTLFVGLNLFQFGFTGFCPLKIILDKLNK